MTASKILKELKKSGGESYKRILMNHGAKEPVLGVKIADMKKMVKPIKGDYPLALELYDTGVYDAQYLAGLITDDSKMTKRDLRRWLSKANCSAISSTTVSWVAAESRYGSEMAATWIEAKKETSAQTGWATMTSLVSIKEDADLDLAELKRLLQRVKKTIHKERNLVRYSMNGFVIAVGCFVKPLTPTASEVAKAIGTITVDMGNTACEVPSALGYIQKVKQRGTLGKKRKAARC